MVGVIKKTISNLKGEEFKEGEKVVVDDCWFNKIEGKIFVKLRFNSKIIITLLKNVEIMI